MKMIILTGALAGITLLAVDVPGEAKSWWSHVQFLADDRLEGRNTGSAGHRIAAEYVANQFKLAGAGPAGSKGYFQPVQFVSRRIEEGKSSLALVRDGKTEVLTLGEDASFGLRLEPARQIDAEAVFVGHGLKIPELGIDDFAGLDLKGKIAVILSGAPDRLPSPIAAHFGSTAQRWAALKAAGAIGMASVGNPKSIDVPWERSKLVRILPSMMLADSSMLDNAGQRVSIGINPAHAEKWFAGTPHTYAELLALDDADKPLPRFPLKAKVRATVAFEARPVTSDNVAGVIPGSDPKLKSQYVVLTGHLDHLGTRPGVNGDLVYNGAMDNASGIATLIEVAKQLAESKPKRSVILLAVTGEEKGLLGSRYFANNPTVPAGSIAANINLDMYLPIVPLRAITAYGIDESTLGADWLAVAKDLGIGIEPDREPDRSLFTRSDQYNFVRRGIPALSFKISAPPGSPENKILKDWIRERYHGVSDDVNQPVNFEAATGFNKAMLALIQRIANNPDRPKWLEKSFFRRFAI